MLNLVSRDGEANHSGWLRGVATTRVMTISRSDGVVNVVAALGFTITVLLLRLHAKQLPVRPRRARHDRVARRLPMRQYEHVDW